MGRCRGLTKNGEPVNTGKGAFFRGILHFYCLQLHHLPPKLHYAHSLLHYALRGLPVHRTTLRIVEEVLPSEALDKRERDLRVRRSRHL